MTKLPPLLLAGVALIAAPLPSPASAQQEVVIFQDVPSVNELNAVLFGKEEDQAPVLKTRSIRFHTEGSAPSPLPETPEAPPVVVEAPQPLPAPEPVQVAAAEPAAEPAPDAVALGFNILFELNSTDMLPESRPYIDRLGEVLSLPENEGKSLLVVGHTDASGGDAYNQRLSEARAQAVRDYLAQAWNVPAQNLDVRGMGESQPLPGTDPLDGTNRRVEFYALN